MIFLHRIVEGGTDRSYGIHVAQLAGLPVPSSSARTKFSAELEKTSGRAVKINPMAAQQAALSPKPIRFWKN